MRKNRFRDKLKQKEIIVSTRLSSTWPVITEVAAVTGNYDYVEFLAEYAPYDQYDIENLARVCELHEISCIMKVDYANRDYVAQKALASGFQGILFTDHTTAEEVRETLKKVKPASPQYQGRLGYVNRRWHKNEHFTGQLEYADYVNDCVIGFMIEKVDAVNNIKEICQVPGVDFIQFGPADFSLNSGFNFKENEARVREIEEKIIKTCLKFGVSPRVEINQADEAKKYIEMGVTHFCLGTELHILRNFYNNEGKQLHTLIRGK